MAESASRNNVSDSYAKKTMPLAFLAPDIVEDIIAGKQPAHLTTQTLIRQIDIPLDWQDQRRAVGFSA
jgi:site-specific DNA recombinase